MRLAIAEGLREAGVLKVGGGYAEASAGYGLNSGPFALAEVGWRPRENLTVFGQGKWSPTDAYAGLGARLTW